MMLLSIVMIPGVLLACIGLIFSIGVLDGTAPALGQGSHQPGGQVENMPPAESVRLH
jgi:hypothetical protein